MSFPHLDLSEMIDKAKMIPDLKKAGFSQSDAEMVADMAVQSADVACLAFEKHVDLMSHEPVLQMQIHIIGTQLVELALNAQREAMMRLIRETGGTIVTTDADGMISPDNVGKSDG